MQTYEFPKSCKKITARKMLASPYREIYADVLQERAIPRKPEPSIVLQSAEMLKNETVECLKKICKSPNSTSSDCFSDTNVIERLHNLIVVHLNNIGDLTQEQQKIMMELHPNLEKAEKRKYKAKLKIVETQLKAAAIQLYIAQHAISLRSTASILQEEQKKHI
jgi:deoxyhypusine synthase